MPLPDILQAARLQLLKERPYLAMILFRLVPVESPGLGALAVDKYWRLYYDPRIHEKMTTMEAVAALYHECHHILRKHMWRFESWSKQDPQKTNICTDLSINSDIRDESWTRKKIKLPDWVLQPEMCGLPPKRLPEEYWDMITKQQEQQAKQQQQDAQGEESSEGGGEVGGGGGGEAEGGEGERKKSSGGGKGKGKGKQSDEQAEEEDGHEEDASESRGKPSKGKGKTGGKQSGQEPGSGSGRQQRESGSGKGDRESGSGKGDRESGSGKGDRESGSGKGDRESGSRDGKGGGQQDAGSGSGSQPKVGGGHCGSVAGGPAGEWEIGPPEETGVDGVGKEESDIIVRETAKEILNHSRSTGNVPGDLERWAREQLEPPKIDWRKVLASVIRAAVSSRYGRDDYSLRRISHRSMARGIVSPGMVSPNPVVAVVVDTSGSMSDRYIQMALSETQGIVRKLGLQWIWLVEVDVQARRARRISTAEKVKLIGGGGTDMGVGIEAAEKLKPAPDVIVVITDGFTPWPSSAPRKPVVIALLGEEGAFPPTPAWARRVEIPAK